MITMCSDIDGSASAAGMARADRGCVKSSAALQRHRGPALYVRAPPRRSGKSQPAGSRQCWTPRWCATRGKTLCPSRSAAPPAVGHRAGVPAGQLPHRASGHQWRRHSRPGCLSGVLDRLRDARLAGGRSTNHPAAAALGAALDLGAQAPTSLPVSWSRIAQCGVSSPAQRATSPSSVASSARSSAMRCRTVTRCAVATARTSRLARPSSL